jgi:hypothetical protein
VITDKRASTALPSSSRGWTNCRKFSINALLTAMFRRSRYQDHRAALHDARPAHAANRGAADH